MITGLLEVTVAVSPAWAAFQMVNPMVGPRLLPVPYNFDVCHRSKSTYTRFQKSQAEMRTKTSIPFPYEWE